MEAKFGELKGQLHGKMLTMVLSLWAGVFALVATLIVKGR